MELKNDDLLYFSLYKYFNRKMPTNIDNTQQAPSSVPAPASEQVPAPAQQIMNQVIGDHVIQQLKTQCPEAYDAYLVALATTIAFFQQ